MVEDSLIPETAQAHAVSMTSGIVCESLTSVSTRATDYKNIFLFFCNPLNRLSRKISRATDETCFSSSATPSCGSAREFQSGNTFRDGNDGDSPQCECCQAGAELRNDPREIPETPGDFRGLIPESLGIAPGIDPRPSGDHSGISSAKSFRFGDRAKKSDFAGDTVSK